MKTNSTHQSPVLLFLLLLTLISASCDQFANGPNEIPVQHPASPIVQIADTLQGHQGKFIEFHILDFFDTEVPLVNTKLLSEELQITSLPNDSFRVAHPSDSAGHFPISAELINEDEYKLDAELIYTVPASDTTTTPDPEEEPAEIYQTKQMVYGKQGESTTFNISDFFESEVHFTSILLSSTEIKIDSLDNGRFRLSQPNDLSGDFTIEVIITNSDQQQIEATLTYSIEPQSEPEPPAPSDGTLVIMPLGDSMTNDSRPRVQLWNLLENDGHDLDYVGNQTQASSIPDSDHEGVGGIKIQGIIDKAESLMQTHHPEYVALMVGTNDIAWYFDESADEIAARWNTLIDLIFASSEPGTYILAATIPPVSSKNVGRSDMSIQDRATMVNRYNAELRSIIGNRQTNGDLIILADMEAALDPNRHLSGDGVHLNEEGYSIMGTVYYKAMNKALNAQN